MLNIMSMMDLREKTTVTPKIKKNVISLVNERDDVNFKIKELIEDIAKESELLRPVRLELLRMEGKIRALKKDLMKERKGKLTNQKIAEKLEITLQQVNNITANRTSYK